MSELSDLLQQREDSQKAMARQDMAVRLANNPDFKQLILKEFCVEECASYAQLSQDPSLTPAQQADALNIAQAAGHLRRWLQIVNRMGDHHRNQMERLDAEIDSVRAEGGE